MSRWRGAMAPKPKLLLMDEAFSSLDTELRLAIVPEVRRILKYESMSAVLVTHDQDEAFAMADKVGVMDAGRIHQWDEPYVLYHLPRTRFVARFVGEGQLIEATAIDRIQLRSALGTHSVHEGHGIALGQSVEILVRPDDIVHDTHERTGGRDRRNIVPRLALSVFDAPGKRRAPLLHGRLPP